MDSIFRFLVLSSLFLYYIWYASFLFSIQVWGVEVAEVLMHGGREAWLTIPSDLVLVLPVMWTIATAGMFFYKRWSRVLFLMLLGASLLLAFTGGLTIMVGPQYAVAMLVSTVDGAVCFMSFFSSVANKFHKSSDSGQKA